MGILLRGGADPERAQRGDHLPRGVKAQRGSIFLPGAFRSLRRRGDSLPGARVRWHVPEAGGIAPFAPSSLSVFSAPPGLLFASPSPLLIFCGTGEFRGSSAFSSGTPGPSSRGRAAGRGRRHLREHPGEWAGRGKAPEWRGPGEFREPSGGSGRDSEQKPRGGAHHSPSGADWCGRGLRGPERAEGRGRDLGEEGPA